MLTHLIKEIVQYRELLFALTYRDIRVKYKQAAFGVAWAFFMPVLAIASGVLFRVAMAIFSGNPLELEHVIAVMVKSLPWLLFASMVGGAANSLVGNMNLLTKIYFPREIVPLSSLLSSLFDFTISVAGFSVLVLGITLWLGRCPLAVTPWLLLVPVFLLVLVLLATGLGMFLAAANLFLRDVKYIVSVVLQFGMFFSLVFFTYEEIGRWGWLLLFNPVAPLLEGIRMAAVDGHVEPFLWNWLAYSTATAVIIATIATLVFERAEALFAEYV